MTQSANLAALGTNVNSSGALTASTLTGTLGYANLPAGSVLQVVATTAYTQQSTTSSTYQDIAGLSASITPKFSTSKVLVLVTLNGCNVTGNGGGIAINGQVLRGSTVITVGNNYGGYIYGPTNLTSVNGGVMAMASLDSPATTSATTYKVQFRSKNGSNNVTVNLNDTSGYNQPNLADSTMSNIILMEIAA